MYNAIITPHTISNIPLDGEMKNILYNGMNFSISLYDDEIQQLINSKYDKRDHLIGPVLIDAECMLLEPDALVPYRKRPTDAGYDIFAIHDGIIEAKRSAKIRTGIAIAVKRGSFYTIEGRSGLGTEEDLVPFRGIIDATYCGELVVKMFNFSDKDYYYKKLERIAQIVYSHQVDANHHHVDKFSEEYNIRGTSGFGSSGK